MKDYYYLKGNEFYECNETCKTCSNEKRCETCREGYYFKVDEDLNAIKTEKCFKELPKNYYFDAEKFVYRPCYKTCATCFKSGTESSNGCFTCKDDYSFFF